MNIFKIAIICAASALALSSCDKQLDLKPTDSLTPLNAFQTINDAQAGTNEAYGRFAAYYNTMYQNALTSDEAALGRDNAGQGALTYRYQYSSDGTTGGDVTSTYSNYYYVIDQTNRVLASLPNVTATAVQEPRRNILKGQMLALRAIAHFGIMQSYCKNYNPADPKGIAYMTVSDPLARPARLTMGASMALIEGDLNTAFSLLPATTAANFSDTVFNQLNINAYRARIALYKGDYANAITYATAVISSGLRPLATTATFGNIWVDAAGSPETLFRIRTGTSAVVGSLFTTSSGSIYIAPSSKLIASFGTGDVRIAASIGGSGTGVYVNKFYTSSRGARIVDVKPCRVAEMYLIRAEAYAKQATPDIALGTADLNTLRSNRISPYTNATFATAADLATAVADERFKELCFEGFRFLDLKRTNQPVQRNPADAPAAWRTLPAGNFRFVYPIPDYEILANPNTVQNDNY